MKDNELKISGCPCDIDINYFEKFFLAQMLLMFPKEFKDLQEIRP